MISIALPIIDSIDDNLILYLSNKYLNFSDNFKSDTSLYFNNAVNAAIDILELLLLPITFKVTFSKYVYILESVST